MIVNDTPNLLMRFSKISVVLIFVTHWFACTLYSIGIYEFQTVGYDWMSLNNLNDASITEQYVSSLYYAATTMCTVGYGDNHPVTTNERIVSMIIMILSSGIFAFVIGDIGRMVSSFNFLAD